MNRNGDMPHLWRGGGRRRAIVLVAALHLCVLLAALQLRAVPPAPPDDQAAIRIVTVTLPKPPVKPVPDDTSAGVKVSPRPSVGVPTARTRERQLRTLPQFEAAPEVPQTALADPLPNLSSLDALPSVAGSGGTGRTGTGAGATGNGKGTGLFADCADTPERPMVADVYEFAVGTPTVREMHARRPLKQVCLAQLNITPRPFRQGIPGIGAVEWFGLDIRFTVTIPEDGIWDLMLLSDDGAILSIDGVEVIDNDGVHAATPRTTRRKLAQGVRHFRVRYYQGPGGEIALMLAWKRPRDAEFDYLPLSLIGRPAPDLVAAGAAYSPPR